MRWCRKSCGMTVHLATVVGAVVTSTAVAVHHRPVVAGGVQIHVGAHGRGHPHGAVHRPTAAGVKVGGPALIPGAADQPSLSSKSATLRGLPSTQQGGVPCHSIPPCCDLDPC